MTFAMSPGYPNTTACHWRTPLAPENPEAARRPLATA
jgi:hypothetical protein